MAEAAAATAHGRAHIGAFGYTVTWGALVLLTGLTFGLSFVRLGAFEVPVAMAIASVKAVLVVLFFMHLLEQRSANWIFVVISVLFVLLLVSLLALDVVTRGPAAPGPLGPQGGHAPRRF